MRTDEELRKIALDLKNLKLFTSLFIEKNESHLLPSIFMPILFMKNDVRQKLIDEKASLFEYYSKSTGMAINGHPTFTSFFWLPDSEVKIVLNYYKDLSNDEEKFLKGGKVEKSTGSTDNKSKRRSIISTKGNKSRNLKS